MLRAKFRCLSVLEHLCGPGPDTTRQVRMRPAMPHAGEDNEGENRRFWDATPSGELEIGAERLEVPAIVGGYYFLDFLLEPGGSWVVQTLTKYSSGTVEVHLYSEVGGKLVMRLTKTAAAQLFDADQHWSVRFQQAV